MCKICQKPWNQKDFYKSNKKKCKECFNEYYQQNKESFSNNFLKHKFGITLEQKRQMWRDQDGKCFLCFKELIESKDCNVDHDHETGTVRRLLCRNCNYCMHGVDNPMWLARAIEYRAMFQ